MTGITVSYDQLAPKYVPLGILVAIFSLIAITLLQYTKRIRKIPGYFKSNFTAFRKNNNLAIVATILYYVLLATPLILLIVWIALLASDSGANPALPILFSFLFVLSLVLPVPGKYFYFKVLTSFVLFITAQLVTMGLFWEDTKQSAFFTLTAILLSINGGFFSIALLLFDGTSWALPQFTSSGNLDKIRSTVEIWKQKENPPKIIDGGLYYYISIRPTLKIIMLVVCYLMSLLTLMTYSLVGFYHTVYGRIALTNSICVITADLVLLMIIFISKQANINPISNAVAGMALRACLVGFSGDLWFLGYCFLYLILGVYLFVLIINKHYPNFQKLPSLTIEKRNILTMPQTPTLLLQLMFAGAVFYVGADDGRTLRTTSFLIDGVKYEFWVIGIAFIILEFAIFFYLISLKIIERSKNRIRSINFYYLGCEGCSEYYFFVFFSYGLLVLLGFYMFAQTGSSFIWNSCVFLPLFYQAFVLFYSNWQDNDYLLLGSVAAYNKKIEKRKERIEKLNRLKTSVMKNMNVKIQNMSQEEIDLKSKPNKTQEKINAQTSNINFLDGAEVESNFMVEDYKGKTYEEWRQTYGLVQAFREDKLLPSDKKIIITLILMLISLVGYCIVYTVSQQKATAVIISVEIVFLFLTFIPMKRYFSTLQTPNVGQIISFGLGMVLNYGFGIISYVLEWNRQDLWTIWWAVINIFLLSVYAALALLRDKGLHIASYITSAVSVLLLIAAGILIIVLFNSIALGVILIAISVYYGYLIGLYMLYLSRNKSLPQFMHYITMTIIVVTCFAIMIYGFVADDFNDFYGFSITYLVINFLIIVYAAYALFMDFADRFDRPNFYSPYGTPVFKYDPAVSSVKTNFASLGFWLGGWLMFYGYTLLMEIFIVDVNLGIAAASIFFVAIFLTFFYFTTYNTYRAGKQKDAISQKVIQQAWQEVLDIRTQSGQTDINIDTLQKQLDNFIKQSQSGAASIQIKPAEKQDPKLKEAQNKDKPKEPQNKDKTKEPQEIDIVLAISDLQQKIQKAIENDEISLVNLWTRIMLKCGTIRKKKMLKFINFIRQDCDVLAEIGVAIVVNDQLYDIQFIYNQAFQQYNMLSPLQKIEFDKKFNAYIERKAKNEQNNEELDKKQAETQKKREEELKRKLQSEDVDDSDLPVQKMKDSPAKMKKLLESLNQPYVDPEFEASNRNLPENTRSECRQWARPAPDAVLLNQDAAMSVKQGYIGDCYLISAIGVLDIRILKKILGIGEWNNAQGAYMVQFKKYGKDIHIIIDSKFPSVGGDEWLLGRCENKKEIFTNILEKAYAKLYGGYQNIVGGKVSIALADMTGGFPEEIKLKKYQQQNICELFNMLTSFKKAGYLMGAGSPQNAQGDAVDVDGIVQGHAYLVMDVRDLDGNKLVKLRNPHGSGGREWTLDWSDNSPKWTKRLLNLLDEKMGDDGAFWMSIDDFVFAFRALYVCRIFDQNIWKRIGPISGEWKGQTAAGLPTKKFPSAQIAKNPQYGIRVTKKATVFVELSQNMNQQRRGENYIFFMVQKNDGRRMTSNAANKLLGTSGAPINSVSISGQVELIADSYPYTFSLMVSAYEQGCEGSYELTMYCDDLNAEVIDTSQFDV